MFESHTPWPGGDGKGFDKILVDIVKASQIFAADTTRWNL
jgi:hypothetical protein